jgi:DNA-binding XRE family transcriptional regulator
VATATNPIEQKVHVIRPRHSVEAEECDIDDLIVNLSQEYDLTSDLSQARQWLANGLPESLSQLRLSKGLSQAELAKKVGLRQPNISAIEAGKRRPEYDTARKIADVLTISTDDFYVAFENGK